MAKRETIIELNGKRYDALSGSLMMSSNSVGGRVINDFAASTSHSATPISKAALVPTRAPLHTQVVDVVRPAAHHIPHHVPKKSQTLTRGAVKKPTFSVKKTAKPVSHTHALVPQPQVTVVKKLAHPQVDSIRAARAQNTPRSQQIHRYAVDLDMKPVANPQAKTIQIKPVHASTPTAHSVATPLASSMDVFERALQRANSHLEPAVTAPKRHKQHGFGKRAFSIAAGALAVLVLGGFIALQNQANLTMKYAAHKAGFAATMPAYKPSGYAVGKFSYSAGDVAVKFTNASSGQSFALVQKTSSWDSNALLSNFVANKDSDYQAVQSAGQTIYTYGKNNATWVNAGIWYQITSDGNLTTSELVNLATSM